MKPAFLFLQQVQDRLKSGQKEIKVPAGTRVSPAALDFIKEKKIKLTYLKGEKVRDKSKKTDVKSEKVRDKSGKTDIKPEVSPAAKSPPATEGNISADELEDVVNLVIERVKQLKGIKPAAAAEKTGKAIEQKKDGEQEKDEDGLEQDLIICRCEEITKEEIRDAIKNGMKSLTGIKRVTRAGMGLCQGQTCQQLIARILAEELGLNPADIEPTTARGPVRPIQLKVYANKSEQSCL